MSARKQQQQSQAADVMGAMTAETKAALARYVRPEFPIEAVRNITTLVTGRDPADRWELLSWFGVLASWLGAYMDGNVFQMTFGRDDSQYVAARSALCDCIDACGGEAPEQLLSAPHENELAANGEIIALLKMLLPLILPLLMKKK